MLLFFSLNVEADHVLFAADAMKFFAEEADKHGFRAEATSNWADMNDENLKRYKLIVWLNSIPPSAQQPAFQRYMENGGAWLGFHVAAYNDRNSRWTWFRQFIGGGAARQAHRRRHRESRHPRHPEDLPFAHQRVVLLAPQPAPR